MKHAALASVLLLISQLTAFASGYDTVSLGHIRIITSELALMVPARPAICSGILEYLAVAPRGKEYESVMVLDCKPMELHAALLLIHARPGGIGFDTTGAVRIFGDTLSLSLFIRKSGKDSLLEVCDLFEPRNEELPAGKARTINKLTWVFTGSEIKRTAASSQTVQEGWSQGSLISLVADRSALINCTTPSRSPYNNSNEGFRVKEGFLCEQTPPLFLKIRKSRPPEAGRAADKKNRGNR